MEDELYRFSPMVRFPQGPGSDLIHFPLIGFNRRVSSLEANALQMWTGFRTIPDAARESTSVSPSLSRDSIQLLFYELEERHCLAAKSQMFAKSESEAIAPEQSPCAISYIAIPTNGRSACLDRAIESYIENVASNRHQCTILVTDDLRDSDASGDCRRVISRMRARSPLNIVHVGFEEKVALVNNLLARCDVSKDVLEFAIFGSTSHSRRPGANRNSILLATAGTMFLSFDDDTVGTTLQVPDTRNSSVLEFEGHGAPEELWCFANREEAIKFAKPMPIDIIGAHQAYLGRSAKAIGRQASEYGGTVMLDRMCNHLFEGILSEVSRVRTTYNGAVGDSGFNSDTAIIGHSSRQTRERLNRDDQEYANLLRSRQIARQVLSPVISHAPSAPMGGFVGLDNRTMLPPYMPAFNSEDGIFATLMSMQFDDNCTAHLPFSMLHDPPGSRRYAPDAATSFRMCDVITGCLGSWPTPIRARPEERLSLIGRHVREIAALAPSDFKEYLVVSLCSLASARIDAMERLLVEDSYSPQHWVDDLDARIESLRSVSEDPEKLYPTDVSGPDNHSRIIAIQSFLDNFGAMAESWPTIHSAARSLNEDGLLLGSGGMSAHA